MTPEQQQQIRIAASLIIQRCIGMLGYPTTHNAIDADAVQADLDKIKAVFYEIDARNSHDDSTQVPDTIERKAA
jgi:hypothetical protein